MNKRIDELGRIVIPSEIRKALNITTQTLIKIDYTNESIILTPLKDKTPCNVCGSIINSTDNYCFNCGFENNIGALKDND